MGTLFFRHPPGSHAPRGNCSWTLCVEEPSSSRAVGDGPSTQSVEYKSSHAERGNQEANGRSVLLNEGSACLTADRAEPTIPTWPTSFAAAAGRRVGW